MNEFNEKEFLDSSLMEDFSRAATDPCLEAAVKKAQDMSKHGDRDDEYIEPGSFTDEGVDELDSMIAHLIDTSARVSGKLSINYPKEHPRAGEANEVNANTALVDLQGFIGKTTADGNIEYLHMFMTVVDNDGRPLSQEEIARCVEDGTSENLNGPYMATAKLTELSIDPDSMHPIRADAWLRIMYPEILTELDDMLWLETNGEASSVEDQISELGSFRVPLPDHSSEQELTKTVQAIVQYALTALSIDDQVPYSLKVRGLYYRDQDEGAQEFSKDARLLFSAKGLMAATERCDDGTWVSLALLGSSHSIDSDRPSEDLIIPLESIVSIRSLRQIILKRRNSSRKH